MTIQFEKLKESCRNYIAYLKQEDSCEDGDADYTNDIFEKAMEACLGENIWEKINQLIDERDNRE